MPTNYCDLKQQNAAAAAALGPNAVTQLAGGQFTARSADGSTILTANNEAISAANRQPNGDFGTAELVNGQLRQQGPTETMGAMNAQDRAASAAQTFRAKLPRCTAGGPS